MLKRISGKELFVVDFIMGTGTGTGNLSFFLVVLEPVSEKIWYCIGIV